MAIFNFATGSFALHWFRAMAAIVVSMCIMGPIGSWALFQAMYWPNIMGLPYKASDDVFAEVATARRGSNGVNFPDSVRQCVSLWDVSTHNCFAGHTKG